jgi:hypothetical protein
MRRRRQLDRHGNRHDVDHGAHHVELALLDLGAGLVEARRDVVEVELDRCRAGVGQVGGVAGPSAGGGAVQRRHDGHVERIGQTLELTEVCSRAGRRRVHRRMERLGLRVRVDLVVEEAVHGELLGHQLLLEQRSHHDGCRRRRRRVVS